MTSRRSPHPRVLAGLVVLGVAVLAALLLVDRDGPIPGVVREPPASVDGLSFVEPGDEPAPSDDRAPAAATLHAPPGGLTVAYFGFLSCPDVCPTTMADIARARAMLDPDVDARLQVAFVTVDPDRDDGERMLDYLGHFFDDGYRALIAADDADLRAAAERLGVTYELEPHDPGDDDYGVTHSAITYLIDEEGLVVRELPFGTSSDDFATAIEASLSAV